MRSLSCLALSALFVSAACAPAAPRDVVGYYWPYGDGSAPYATVTKNPDAITMLCPTWMGIKGSEGEIHAKEDPKLSELARAHGIKIVPIIWGSDRKQMHSIFSNIFNRTRLAKNIVAALDSFSYCQGVNLDFEGVDPADRWAFGNFLIELNAKLKPKGYLLTIDVPAKARENLKNPWQAWCDYAEVGRTCDAVMIMAYPEHSESMSPGPISSVQLCERVLAYAVSQMPRERVYLGLPLYGTDWPKKGRGKTCLYDVNAKRVQEQSIKVLWDAERKVPWYTFADPNGEERICYFENAASIAAKLDIARKYGIGGVSFWCLGQEDPAVWETVRVFRQR